MKTIHKLSVILFTVCLILSSVTLPVLIISTRSRYYVNQFKKCDIYPENGQTVKIGYIGGVSVKTADFTSEQIDEIVKHITDFLAGKKKSFALEMDGVLINGRYEDNVNIFCDTSVTHMEDVRQLFNTVKIISLFILLIIAGSAVWMLTHKKEIRPYVFKYSLFTVFGMIGCILLFLLIVLAKTAGTELSMDNFLNTLWEYMHYIFFPFDPNKFSGSFFNDTLTMILTLEFFINTVVTVLINVGAITASWLFSAKLIEKRG